MTSRLHRQHDFKTHTGLQDLHCMALQQSIFISSRPSLCMVGTSSTQSSRPCLYTHPMSLHGMQMPLGACHAVMLAQCTETAEQPFIKAAKLPAESSAPQQTACSSKHPLRSDQANPLHTLQHGPGTLPGRMSAPPSPRPPRPPPRPPKPPLPPPPPGGPPSAGSLIQASSSPSLSACQPPRSDLEAA